MKSPFRVGFEQGRPRKQNLRQKRNFDFEETLKSGENFDEQTTTVIKSDPGRIRWLQFALVATFVIILGRTGYLQIVKGQYYRGLSDRNAVRTEVTPASRGVIYDRDHNVLAQNKPSFDLVIMPDYFPKDENARNSVIYMLSPLIRKSEQELRDFMAGLDPASAAEVILKENIPREEALVLETAVADWPGLEVVTVPIRQYAEGFATSHIIGYTGRITREEVEDPVIAARHYRLTDRLGKTGLESYFEEELRGQPGQKLVEVDALERVNKVIASKDPVPGNNLVLSLDFGLQKKLRESLAQAIRSAGVHQGAAVALNPHNGEILALVSLPDFDANQFAEGLTAEQYGILAENPEQPLFDRAIGGAFPPGSTFKPFVGAAALSEGIVTPQTVINSTGKVQAGNRAFYDYRPGGHGRTNIYKAIAESVNSYFYKVAGGLDEISQPLGANNIFRYAEFFGFNKQTGIDLPGEIAGTIPNPEWKEKVKGEQWFLGDTLNMAIGQGDVLVTPLQLAVATAAIANGGRVYEPHLAREFIDPETEEVKRVEPKLVRENFIDPAHLETIRQAMRQTVTSGSGRSLSSLAKPVSGKTGTAQILGENQTHAWFTCFASDPEIVLSILVVKGGEGHQVAAPVAKEVLGWYFDRN